MYITRKDFLQTPIINPAFFVYNLNRDHSIDKKGLGIN